MAAGAGRRRRRQWAAAGRDVVSRGCVHPSPSPLKTATRALPLRPCPPPRRYHAGIEDAAKRADVQRRWSAGHYKVICATVAFGMGINKSDVR